MPKYWGQILLIEHVSWYFLFLSHEFPILSACVLYPLGSLIEISHIVLVILIGSFSRMPSVVEGGDIQSVRSP